MSIHYIASKFNVSKVTALRAAFEAQLPVLKLPLLYVCGGTEYMFLRGCDSIHSLPDFVSITLQCIEKAAGTHWRPRLHSVVDCLCNDVGHNGRIYHYPYQRRAYHYMMVRRIAQTFTDVVNLQKRSYAWLIEYKKPNSLPDVHEVLNRLIESTKK
ncbi:MAG: hypothetical protein QXT13_07615 [Pyrobaculum sp.]